jgi:type IV pilus assembly protein PilW
MRNYKRPVSTMSYATKARGVSLIELMVGMVIALLITAAIGVLYVSSKESSRVQDGTNSARESGGAISELVSREVRKSGNYGCFTWKQGASIPLLVTARLPTAQGGTFPVPTSGTAPDLTPNIGPDYDVRGGDISGLDLSAYTTLTKVSGSDFVQMNYGQPVAYATQDMPDANAAIYLGEPIEVKSGQPFLIADCDSMQLLRVDEGGINGGMFSKLTHDPALGDNTAPANTVFGGAMIQKGAVLMKLASSTMFLATDAEGRTGLYLWDTTVRDASGRLRPFAQDVIKMRVLFGVDNGGTLLWSNGATVTANAQWKDVRAVQLHYVVASSESTASVTPKEMVWSAARQSYVAGTNAAPGNKIQQAYSVTSAIRGRVPVFIQ